MEKAILKTLIFFDLVHRPVTAWQIQKWLISKKSSLKMVEKSLTSLIRKSKIKSQDDYYFLSSKSSFKKRLLNLQLKQNQITKLFQIVLPFKLWPSNILLVGGGVNDLSNQLTLLVIEAEQKNSFTRSITLKIVKRLLKNNIELKLLNSDSLGLSDRNIYSAYFLLNFKVFWQKGSIYQLWLEQNFWAFNYFPNWLGTVKPAKVRSKNQLKKLKTIHKIDLLDNIELASFLEEYKRRIKSEI